MSQAEIPKRRKAFGTSFWIFSSVAVVSGALCYWLKGEAVFMETLRGDLNLLLKILPRIFAAILIAGFIQVLLPRDLVSKWIGEESGMKGILIASCAGIVMPGGPMTSFPLVAALYASGADRGALVAYVTAWSLLGLQRILTWELPFMGPEFVIMRVLVTLFMPIMAGMIARQLPISIGPDGERSA